MSNWNKDKVYIKSKHEILYDLLDERNIKVLKRCPSVLMDTVTWYDTGEAGIGDSLLYLRTRGLVTVHPYIGYLYRFK